MSSLRAIVGAGLAAAALVSCSRLEPARDKAWYAAHEAQRTADLAVCNDDPGRLGGTPNCINAQSADSDARAARFYDAPRPRRRAAGDGRL